MTRHRAAGTGNTRTPHRVGKVVGKLQIPTVGAGWPGGVGFGNQRTVTIYGGSGPK